MTPINVIFRGGPFDGLQTRLNLEVLQADRLLHVEGQAYYRVIDGPILRALHQGARSDHLCVLLEHAPLKRLEIEDDSDCATCTKRHEGVMEMLSDVKCDVLSDLTCPECGRTYSLLVQSDD